MLSQAWPPSRKNIKSILQFFFQNRSETKILQPRIRSSVGNLVLEKINLVSEELFIAVIFLGLVLNKYFGSCYKQI